MHYDDPAEIALIEASRIQRAAAEAARIFGLDWPQPDGARPTMTTRPIVRLVQLVMDEVLTTDIDSPDVAAAMEIRGYREIGRTSERGPQRVELRDRPKYAGLVGPMWGGSRDGRPILRYEEERVYALLSA